MARRRSTSRGSHGVWSVLAAKRRWTGQEARTLLEAQLRSGQTLAAFARQHDLPLPRLYEWRRRLGRRGVAAAVAPRFLPVRIAAPDGSAAAQASRIEIVLRGGRRIRVPQTFDPLAVGRLVEILEHPGC